MVNRSDLLAYFCFYLSQVTTFALQRNPGRQIFPISAKTGEGVEAWCDWLRCQVKAWNEA